jgi:alkanesulfonate monooxygenase SsuD/methylene tetrahydromethanopterin reductase-like flavin-dependent oxidoreductase (luciferase family)
VLSAFIIHVLTYVGLPAVILAIGRTAWNVSRAKLLQRAGDTALDAGDRNPRGRAGLEIVKALTSENEPWYRALLPPWRRPDDNSP